MSALTEAIAVADRVPKIGFGTWLLEEGDERYTAVPDALRLGYRRIDTARAYHNEFSVGRCGMLLIACSPQCRVSRTVSWCRLAEVGLRSRRQAQAVSVQGGHCGRYPSAVPPVGGQLSRTGRKDDAL